MEGYTKIVNRMMDNASYLSSRLQESGEFKVMNDANHIPVVTFSFSKKEKFTLFDLSYRIRERGWIVPAYSLPPHADDITIMRVVVRENFTRDMVDIFVEDILNAKKALVTGSIRTSQRSSREGHPVS